MGNELYILFGKDQGKSFRLESGKKYIAGRGQGNEIILNDPCISRKHFKIQIKDNKFFLTDLFSKNGIFINGRELSPGIEIEIREGVPILIGKTILGLGEMCESSLKPFLDSAAFKSEVNEYGEAAELIKIVTLKKNLKSIYRITNSIMESKDIKEISAILLINIFNLLKRVDLCVVLLVDDETGKIGHITSHSRKQVEDPRNVFNPEIVKQALIMKQPIIVDDSDIIENEDDKLTESLHLMKIRSAMCVPIAGSYGVRGAIYVESLERPCGFLENDVALLKDVSSRAFLAMENVSLEMSDNFVQVRQSEEEVQILHGILSICSYCKNIRNDKGMWDSLEVYISEHSEAEFSHGVCPECYKKFKNGEL